MRRATRGQRLTSREGSGNYLPRLTFERELASLRESVVRMGTLVESQIEAYLDALRRRDGPAAEKARAQDRYLNELFKQIREQIFMVIATQQPVAPRPPPPTGTPPHSPP